MYKSILIFIVLNSITCSRFLEEKLDFTVDIDYQGLKHCMTMNVVENKLNKLIVGNIDKG